MDQQKNNNPFGQFNTDPKKQTGLFNVPSLPSANQTQKQSSQHPPSISTQKKDENETKPQTSIFGGSSHALFTNSQSFNSTGGDLSKNTMPASQNIFTNPPNLGASDKSPTASIFGNTPSANAFGSFQKQTSPNEGAPKPIQTPKLSEKDKILVPPPLQKKEEGHATFPSTTNPSQKQVFPQIFPPKPTFQKPDKEKIGAPAFGQGFNHPMRTFDQQQSKPVEDSSKKGEGEEQMKKNMFFGNQDGIDANSHVKKQVFEVPDGKQKTEQKKQEKEKPEVVKENNNESKPSLNFHNPPGPSHSKPPLPKPQKSPLFSNAPSQTIGQQKKFQNSSLFQQPQDSISPELFSSSQKPTKTKSIPQSNQSSQFFTNSQSNPIVGSSNRRNSQQHVFTPKKLLSALHRDFCNQVSIQRSLELLLNFSVNQPYMRKQSKFYEKSYQINRFINDCTNLICQKFQIQSSAFDYYGNIFYQMLQEKESFANPSNFIDQLFETGIYVRKPDGQVEFQQNQGTINILIDFVEQLQEAIKNVMKFIRRNTNALMSVRLIEVLFSKMIILGKRTPQSSNSQIFRIETNFDHRVISILEELLMSWIKNVEKNHESWSIGFIKNIIKDINELPIGVVSQIAQKMLIKICLQNKKTNFAKQGLFVETENEILLPFRMLQTKNMQQNYQYGKKVAKVVQGPHWLPWIQYYLDNTREYQPFEIANIVKSFNSLIADDQFHELQFSKKTNIKKFIYNLRQQYNYSLYFYQLISIVMQAQKSKINENLSYFFPSQNSLVEQLKTTLIDHITKYPGVIIQNEDFQQLKTKAVFYLTIIECCVDKVFEFENGFFDIYGFSDQKNERCDRVCNTVLDCIALFSGYYFDEEVIIRALSAVTVLLNHESSKYSMGLAMNINRPQLSFANQNLSNNFCVKLGDFLTKLANTKQFYESVRSSENSIQNTSIYSSRYNIEKYLLRTARHNSSVPVYWFAQPLKILTKHSYNPKLMYLILSKLQIIPCANVSSQIRPYILEVIVESLNNANFWGQFMEVYQIDAFMQDNKLVLLNRYLFEEQSMKCGTIHLIEALDKIYYSLKMLKILLRLIKIVEYSKAHAPTHFVISLLSHLKPLSEISKRFLNKPSLQTPHSINIHHQMSNKTSPINWLITLAKYHKYRKNDSKEYQQDQWTYADVVKFDPDHVKQLYRSISHLLDFQVINDILIHPNNRYLENCDSIASLAFDCLVSIVQQSPQANIQSVLYAAIPENHSFRIQNSSQWKSSIIRDIVGSLSNEDSTLGASAWKFVVSLRKSRYNHSFSNQIFKAYLKSTEKLPKSIPITKLITQFIAICSRQKNFDHHQILQELIDNLFGDHQFPSRTLSLELLISNYQTKVFPLEYLFNQFERNVLEREITHVVDLYTQIQWLLEIILRMFYQRHCGFQKYMRHIIRFIAYGEFLQLVKGAVNHKERDLILQQEQSNYTRDIIDISQETPTTLDIALRTQGTDSLNNYLVNKSSTRQQILQIQISNVIKQGQLSLSKLVSSIYEFLFVTLSFDQHFYANHLTSTQTKKFSEMFCQLHLGTMDSRCQEIFGENIDESLQNISNFIDTCLMKIDKIKANQFYREKIQSFMLLDLLINWFSSNASKYSHNQTNNRQFAEVTNQQTYLINKIMSTCFTMLGQPIIHPVSAKLLLSLVNIGSQSVYPETLTLIKETIYRTLIAKQFISAQIKQYLIPLLLVIPPSKSEVDLVEIIVKMWIKEDNNQYFYNLSRVILKLCETHPIQMCKNKLFSRNARLQNLVSPAFEYYHDGLRTSQNISWIWVLKIATSLLESSNEAHNSTIVIHEIKQFYKKCSKHIIDTLSAPRKHVLSNTGGQPSHYKSKYASLEIYLAQIDELEATLQFITSLFRCDIWRISSSNIIEQLLYLLMNQTVFMFTGIQNNNIETIIKKRYKPCSDCEKTMWNINIGKGQFHQPYQNYSHEKQMEEEISVEIQQDIYNIPNIFVLLMSLRFIDCAKIWMVACSMGMKNSRFVREYFYFTDGKGSKIKYSLTHWDHMNKALNDIMKQNLYRVQKWLKWEKIDEVLAVIQDSYKSAKVFTEQGYLTTLVRFPQNQRELQQTLSINVALCLQMCAYHLISQIYFQKKHGTPLMTTLSNFKKKILELENGIQKKLKENSVAMQNMLVGKKLMEGIQIWER